MDRLWNVMRANGGALRLFSLVVGAPMPTIAGLNALQAIFVPGPLRDAVVNWEEIAGSLVARLHREIAAEPDDRDRVALLRSLLDQPGVPARLAEPSLAAPAPFIAVHLRVGELELRFFTMLTTLGTPQDVTAQELTIESYFPADDATDRWLRAL